jgi:hypothetical protein
VQRLCRGVEVAESFEDSKGVSSGGTMLLYMQARLNVIEFAEERRKRLKPLIIENSSKFGKKVPKLRRSNSCRRISREDLDPGFVSR